MSLHHKATVALIVLYIKNNYKNCKKKQLSHACHAFSLRIM